MEAARKVLILDDDDAVRESLVGHFEDRGWQVVWAATAEQALEILPAEKPEGAIVDIRLPGMDGNQFVRQVSVVSPGTVCVVCTGSPEYLLPDDVETLPQVCDTVFTKPVVDLNLLEEALIGLIQASERKEIQDE